MNTYLRERNFDEAIFCGKKLVANVESQYGRNDVQMAIAYYSLGRAYLENNELDVAMDNYEKALNIREEQLETNNADTAEIYHDIGFVYDKKNEIDTALEFYRKAKEIKDTIAEEQHDNIVIRSSLAATYNNIGNVYGKKMDTEQ